MAADGDTMIAGTRKGPSYVFERVDDEWTQIAMLEMVPRSEGEGRDGRVIEDVAVNEEAGIAALGLPGTDVEGETDAGTVEVYERIDGFWEPQTRLVGPVNGDENDRVGDGNHGPHFGRSVAVADGRVLVGAPEVVTEAGRWTGSAFLYEQRDSGWVVAQVFSDDDPTRDEHFGIAVALDGPFAAITAVEERYPPEQTGLLPEIVDGAVGGAVTVFKRLPGGSWDRQTEFHPAPDPSETGVLGIRDSCLGWDVDVESETLIVGDPCGRQLPMPGSYHGLAFVLKHGDEGWRHEATLAAPDRLPTNADFGRSVAVGSEGSMAVVGAPTQPTWYTATGSAYVFERVQSDWVSMGKLLSNETSVGDWFGWTVEMSDDTILVGAQTDTNQQNGMPYPLNDQDDASIPPGTEISGWVAGSVYAFEAVNGVNSVSLGPRIQE